MSLVSLFRLTESVLHDGTHRQMKADLSNRYCNLHSKHPAGLL